MKTNQQNKPVWDIKKVEILPDKVHLKLILEKDGTEETLICTESEFKDAFLLEVRS